MKRKSTTKGRRRDGGDDPLALAALWASIRGWFGGAKEADLVPLAVSLREAEVKLNQVSTKPAGVEPPTGVIWHSYYYVGSQRIAMRIHTTVETHVYYLHADHLPFASLRVLREAAPA